MSLKVSFRKCVCGLKFLSLCSLVIRHVKDKCKHFSTPATDCRTTTEPLQHLNSNIWTLERVWTRWCQSHWNSVSWLLTSFGPKVNFDTDQSISTFMLKTIKHRMSMQERLTRSGYRRLLTKSQMYESHLHCCRSHIQTNRYFHNCTVTWSQEEVLFTHNSTGTVLQSTLYVYETWRSHI